MNPKRGHNVRPHEGKMTKKRTIENEDKPVITDKEFLIIQTKIMRLSEREALVFLEVQGYKMERSAYFEAVKEIAHKIDARSMEIARTGLLETHMKIIDTLVTCERNLWNNYHRLAENPYKQSQVIKLIIEIQPFISQAYAKTRVVMEAQAEMRSKVFSEN